MKDFQKIKLELYKCCVAFVDQRILNIQQAIDAAGDSGNDETKSSAGDKHETGRAMMQLEQENNTNQLLEASKLKEQISKINSEKKNSIVAPGCLVITNKGGFYIAISAGKVEVGDDFYYAISPVSPIASMLLQNKVGAKVDFNGQQYMIEKIY